MHKDDDKKIISNKTTKLENNNNNNKSNDIKTKINNNNKDTNNLNLSNINNTTSSDINSTKLHYQQQQQEQLDIARENRLSQIIALYSKGLTQAEIAQKIQVNQSTISRDIQYLKQQAKTSIWKYLNEDILFEYLRYIVGNNEISKKLWEIVQDDENSSAKDKTNALALLNQSYTKRLEILMNGVESFKDVKKNISEIEEIEMMEKDPMLKLSSKLAQLQNPFSKR
jgi:hypothetical protein